MFYCVVLVLRCAVLWSVALSRVVLSCVVVLRCGVVRCAVLSCLALSCIVLCCARKRQAMIRTFLGAMRMYDHILTQKQSRCSAKALVFLS